MEKTRSMAMAQKLAPRTPVGNRGARVGRNVLEQIMNNARQGGPEGHMGSRKEKPGKLETDAFNERVEALRAGDDGNSDQRACVFAPF
jgi:hypothetical protein